MLGLDFSTVNINDPFLRVTDSLYQYIVEEQDVAPW